MCRAIIAAFNPQGEIVMSNPNHDSNGRFATGEGAAGNEGTARASARYPVAPHGGAKSVGSHRGGLAVVALDERTNTFKMVASGKRTAVAESIARGQRADGRYAKIFRG
jgi:hypothetical protein